MIQIPRAVNTVTVKTYIFSRYISIGHFMKVLTRSSTSQGQCGFAGFQTFSLTCTSISVQIPFSFLSFLFLSYFLFLFV